MKEPRYDSPFSFTSETNSNVFDDVSNPIANPPADNSSVINPVAKKGRDRNKDTMPHDDVALYNSHQNKSFEMDKRLRVVIILLVANLVLLPLIVVLPVNVFNINGLDRSFVDIGMGIAGRMQAAGEMFSGTSAGRAIAIYFWQLVAVALAGAALSLNGAVYQGAMKNALASPSTLGVMSGATLGTVIYTLCFYLPSDEVQLSVRQLSEITAELNALNPFEYFVFSQARVLCSVGGSLIIVALVLIIAYIAGRGHVSKVGLVVAGQVFTAAIASIIELVRFYIARYGSEVQMESLRSIVGGSFDNIWNPSQVLILAIPVVLGVMIVLVLAPRLNSLAFSEEEARSMGVNVNRTRSVVIGVCTLLTAIIVAFCGNVGFVGFLVPHLARKIVGPDFRFYIPTSILLGSAYLLVAYYLMNLGGFMSGSVGTFTSLIGVVFFFIMAIRQRARGNVEWV